MFFLKYMEDLWDDGRVFLILGGRFAEDGNEMFLILDVCGLIPVLAEAITFTFVVKNQWNGTVFVNYL